MSPASSINHASISAKVAAGFVICLVPFGGALPRCCGVIFPTSSPPCKGKKVYQRELFYAGLKKGPNLRFCVICAVANETSVADAFEVFNPVSLLWREPTAFEPLHLDP